MLDPLRELNIDWSPAVDRKAPLNAVRSWDRSTGSLCSVGFQQRSSTVQFLEVVEAGRTMESECILLACLLAWCAVPRTQLHAEFDAGVRLHKFKPYPPLSNQEHKRTDLQALYIMQNCHSKCKAICGKAHSIVRSLCEFESVCLQQFFCLQLSKGAAQCAGEGTKRVEMAVLG